MARVVMASKAQHLLEQLLAYSLNCGGPVDLVAELAQVLQLELDPGRVTAHQLGKPVEGSK